MAELSCQETYLWETNLFDPEKTEVEVPKKPEKFGQVNIGKKNKPKILYVPLEITVRTKQNGEKVTREVYKVEEEVLGSGSFGVVFKYTNDKKQSFALKITQEEEDTFQYGGHTISLSKILCQQLRLRKLGRNYEGSWYYLMPVMDGDLRKFLLNKADENDLKNLEKRKQIAEKVLQQVHCIFEATGLPYLDLKPENVMYRRDPLCVQLGDLGSLVPTGPNGTMMRTYLPPTEFETGIFGKDKKYKNQLLSWAVGTFLLHVVAGDAFLNKFYMVDHASIEKFKQNAIDTIQNAQDILEKYFGKKYRSLLNYEPAGRITLAALLENQSQKLSLFSRFVQFFKRKK